MAKQWKNTSDSRSLTHLIFGFAWVNRCDIWLTFWKTKRLICIKSVSSNPLFASIRFAPKGTPFFFFRYSTWIPCAANGYLSWPSLLVWRRIYRLNATGVAEYIANGTAHPLVSSALFAAGTDFRENRSNDDWPCHSYCKQTSELRCYNRFANRGHRRIVQQHVRPEKSVLPVYWRPYYSTTRYKYSITVGSVLGPFRCPRSTKW